MGGDCGGGAARGGDLETEFVEAFRDLDRGLFVGGSR